MSKRRSAGAREKRHARLMSLALMVSLSVTGSAIAPNRAFGNQPTRAQMHAVARALIPPKARLVRLKDAACGEQFAFPSCVDAYFQDKGPLKQRVTAFLGRARSRGWKLTRHRGAGGEEAYAFLRGRYSLTAGFWLDKYYRPTRGCDAGRISRKRPATCADHFELRLIR